MIIYHSVFLTFLQYFFTCHNVLRLVTYNVDLRFFLLLYASHATHGSCKNDLYN